MFRSTRVATVHVAASNAEQISQTESDFLCDGTADDVEIQAALDSLPTTGGKVFLSEGTFTLSAQIARTIDDVQIEGSGAGTNLVLDGVTAIITAGSQSTWALRYVNTDAGGLDVSSATESIAKYWLNGIWTEAGEVGIGSASLTQEEVEDFAGNMIDTGGTKTGIAVTYNDNGAAAGDMDFVVNHDTANNFTTTEHFTMLDQDDLVGDDDTQAATQQSIKAYVDAQAPTGGLIHADYVVDSTYTGSEGATATLSTGSTGKMFSTVQLAVTEADSDNGLPYIYIYNGTYSENVIIPATMGSGNRMTIEGESRDGVILGTATLGITFATGSCDVTLRNMTLTGSTHALGTSTTGCKFYAENLIINGLLLGSWVGSVLNNCSFGTLGRFDTATAKTATGMYFVNLNVNSAISWKWDGSLDNVHFMNMQWSGFVTNSKIEALADVVDVSFTTCELGLSVAQRFIKLGETGAGGRIQVIGLRFTDCYMPMPPNSDGIIWIANLNTLVPAPSVILNGNVWRDNSTHPYVTSTGETDSPRVVANSNDWGNNVDPIFVGDFSQSSFGINTPPEYDINITAGAGNIYYGTNVGLTGVTGTVSMPVSTAVLTDDAILRGAGGAYGIQTSGIIIDDTDNITAVTTLTVDGDVSAADPATIGFSSTGGLVLTGDGSSEDVTIYNNAKAAALWVDTGTINVNLGGDLLFNGTDSIIQGSITSIYIEEDTAAAGDSVGRGQFWVRDDEPNTPMFTDDVGTDFVLTDGGGDVLGDTASVDKELVRFNGAGGKTIESPNTDVATTTATLSDNADLTLYNAIIDGGPSFKYGSSATNKLNFNIEYDSGAQTLRRVNFQSDSSNAAADSGNFRFIPDGSIVLIIDDDGLEVTGDVDATGTFNPSGDVTAADAAAIGGNATDGLSLTGQGSASDVTIYNDAKQAALWVETGTVAVQIGGDLNFNGTDSIIQGSLTSIYIEEDTAAAGDISGNGQFWVRASDSLPMFTGDDGVDNVLAFV